ncbi:PTS lactose transporter subunit IIC [Sphingomonas spermidinifaciens]|uniref:PTS lactose transporter subunit IIC n=1 Tax=Sphingomonas spermidinifaciens TaxID=1141889 RepID=A0A2A4BA49_9SPHN|nr:PTS sugar transporter subunit IIA [Sphingomonas spermidinifaciens]PCD04514.1 PTS lactose transporter subunit IIC [Sphingomonas spermidinifaciens]
MTDLSDLIAPEAVVVDLAAGNKKALFQQLAAAAAGPLGVEPKLLLDRLLAREKLGSTGFGGGIAIPHARIEELGQVRALFARLSSAVDFQAVDGLPVDLVMLLVSPVDAGGEHLKALARVSRRLRDAAFADKLRGAGSRDAIYALLTGVEARDAA